MLTTRVMPCLLLDGERLVKTVKFRHPRYVGDPVNAIRIYNEKEVDELVLLDVSATREGRGPPLRIVAEVASECFMPLTYGGGVRSPDDLRELFRIGVEKVAINSAAAERPALVREAADRFGSQAVIASIDVKRGWLGRYRVHTRGGRRDTGLDPVAWAVRMQEEGAGELLLTSIDRDGTWQGYDLELLAAVTRAVDVPVIASGGAGRVEHFGQAVREGGASAVAAGSMVVFQGQDLGVLIRFPTRAELQRVLE